ncbi:MAG: glutamine--fructose-6-phosphate transaminase (isomerizing) [Chitinispirillia bacterium]|nr:glutamine--fructose-6-phosphate transaminase (isomerizing) [Chitinispirillia bacterium]MCL2268369.1 glutamine--fructose-6-phosphate transaminase (isomerizing) [Chitinispirillia bacterium]
MCGIVAYIGSKPALPILINGLKRLEYRGYDSAGVSVLSGGAVVTVKSVGKIAELEKKAAARKAELDGILGVSHTRWATHGEPSEANAHPHLSADGKIAVVHNGIIENYVSVKKILESEGVKFASETDTEVIAHWISRFYRGNLGEAVREALKSLEGTFGLAVICRDEPEVLIGARRGSPLILGVGAGECFLASDVSAIVGHTQKIVYLEDNDVVEIDRGAFSIHNITGQSVSRELKDIEANLEIAQKGDFPHFMLKEIFEQPEALRNCTRGRLLLDKGNAKLAGLDSSIQELRSIDRIIITACGTSYYAAMVGEYLIEDWAGIPVEVEYASEFRYRNPIIGNNTLIFTVSQSGETADTLAALREAKEKGATVLSICNVVGSTIARASDGGVYLHAGAEIGVASTKAFNAQVVVLALIALLLGRQRRLSNEHGIEIANAISKLPALVEETLKLSGKILEIARHFYTSTNFLYLGRHYHYPVAMEGALKLKEISYIHAEGYPAAEMKHGPIALIDANMPVVIVAPKDALFDKIVSNAMEIKARGGKLIVVATSDCSPLDQYADHIITVPATTHALMPVIASVPLQLLAYHIAVLRGNDVDMPRNLAKSVTVE